MRVLLVEDHADTRELFVHFLSSNGFTVETAANGQQAVDQAAAAAPDVVVLDLQLPGMDGWTTARHLRAHPSTVHTPIVAVSAHAYEQDEARAHDVGCDAFVAKPCAPPDLLNAIQIACDRRRRPR
jgi:two-component system, cell cycle response regulator DivK